MKKRHWLLFVASAAILPLLFNSVADAQRRGGGGARPSGGGARPSVGARPGGSPAAHFGTGSVVHRDFSPSPGMQRPNIRPATPSNVRPNTQKRPDLPKIPDHSRPDHLKPDRPKPDHSRPGHLQPDIPQPDHSKPDHSRPHHDGPDWKNWKDIDRSKIHHSVVNKHDVNRDTISKVRDHFDKHYKPDRFWTNDWFKHHPGGWHPIGPPPPPPFWWHRPHWHDTWGWFVAGFFTGVVADAPVQPIPYYYGSNIVYEGETVYINDVPYVGADEYYQQARDLAESGADAAEPTEARKDEAQADWLSMGTFAIVSDGNEESLKRILQIATDKHGRVRGNLVNSETEETTEFYGSVDPKTQRVAFKVKGNDKIVAECGLWNLTQDTVPLLIHVNEDRTEERTLIRLSAPEDGKAPAEPAP